MVDIENLLGPVATCLIAEDVRGGIIDKIGCSILEDPSEFLTTELGGFFDEIETR